MIIRNNYFQMKILQVEKTIIISFFLQLKIVTAIHWVIDGFIMIQIVSQIN